MHSRGGSVHTGTQDARKWRRSRGQTGGTILMQRPWESMGLWSLGKQEGGQQAGGHLQVQADDAGLWSIMNTLSCFS